MRGNGRMIALVFGAALAAMSLVACVETRPPTPPPTGECCVRTGPVFFDCASIENLGPGADLDGRCNAVNQGHSCSWVYSDAECCEIAVADGFGDVTCGPSGDCCVFTGPVAFDCASIENLGPGADLDGRCNAVNQGQSCEWLYSDEECCEIAVNDGFGDATCGASGKCCEFTGPVGFDCKSIESLPPGADFDGRCNAVNQGQSCTWNFADETCCEVAATDANPGNVTCN